ncbi:unnamed protein product, partial [Polarella glacialis]
MAFDWFEPGEGAREPWARLLKDLMLINFERWAPPPPMPPPLQARRLLSEEGSWEPGSRAGARSLTECPADSFLDPLKTEDFQCTFSYRCPQNLSSSTARPEECEKVRGHLAYVIGSEDSPFYARMKSRCVGLKLQRFSPP